MALNNNSFKNYMKEIGYASVPISSFNTFLNTEANDSIAGRNIKCSDGSLVEFLRFEIEDLSLNRTTASMSPQKARINNATYASNWYLVARITEVSGGTSTKKVKVGSVPLMVGCDRCFTKGLTDNEKKYWGEDPNDRGGYFIIRGMEMYITNIDRTSTDTLISIGDKVKNDGDHKVVTPANTRITLTTDRGTDLNMVSFNENILRFSLPSIVSDDKSSKYSINVVRLYMLLGMEFSEIVDSIVEIIGDKYRGNVQTLLMPSFHDVQLTPDHIAVLSSLFTFSKLKMEEKNSKRLRTFDNRDKELAKIMENVDDIASTRDFLHTSGMVSDIINSIREVFGDEEKIIYSMTLLNKEKTSGKLREKDAKKLEKTRKKLDRLRVLYEIEKTLEADLFPFVEGRFKLDYSDSPDAIKRNNEFIRDKKIKMLSMLVARHIEMQIGIYQPDNRDSWINKRLTGAGKQLLQKVRASIGITFSQAHRNSLNEENPAQVIKSIAESMKLETNVNRLFFPQKGGEEGGESGNARYTNGTCIASLVDNLNLIVSPVSSRSNAKNKRELPTDAIGAICPVRITENGVAGLVKSLACTARVARASSHTQPIPIIEGEGLLTKRHRPYDGKMAKVIISGSFIGWTEDKYKLRDSLISKKRLGGIDRECSISLTGRDLLIFTTGGYIVRPLLVVDIETQQLKCELESEGSTKTDKIDFEEWVSRGWIELVSCREQDMCVVALDQTYLEQQRERIKNLDVITVDDILSGNLEDKPYYFPDLTPISNDELMGEMLRRLEAQVPQITVSYTYCEIWKSAILGHSANLSPYSEQNQAPRNAYQSGMPAQALGRSFINRISRYHETTKISSYATETLVRTSLYEALNLGFQGTGVTLMTAITADEGTEEDGNKENLDTARRGATGPEIQNNIKIKINTSEGVTIGELPKDLRRRDKNYDAVYSLTDSKGMSGYPKLQTYVKEGDCIVSAYKEVDGVKTDKSYYLRFGDEGIITSYTKTVDEKGKGSRDKIIINVTITTYDLIKNGNKASTENSQKSTLCKLAPSYTLPYNEFGETPDIFTTIHSFPTRMTVSSFQIMMETALAAIIGIEYNSDVFRDKLSFREIEDSINGAVAMRNLITGEEYTYDGSCYHMMRSGLTGEPLKNPVFMAPINWQLLKHLTDLKEQKRGPVGPKDSKTNQPNKGRKRGGGLKVGVQNRNAMASCGAARYCVQRYTLTSNRDEVVVCGFCGTEAIPYNDPSTDYYKDLYYCGICDPTNQMPTEDKEFYRIYPTTSFTNLQKFVTQIGIRMYVKVMSREQEALCIEHIY